MKFIPTGIENFKELIDNKYYYVDKTNFINDVIKEKVALYTRPRRFGKTLNMSMLYYFFSNKEIGNSYLFEDLNISHNTEALKHQNKYPTIFISLKDMKNNSLKKQMNRFKEIISLCAKNYLELLTSPSLLESEKKLFRKYVDNLIQEDELESALFNISYFLNKHYHQKVILLIDEYDVPLQSAYQNQYYEEMVDFLRNTFSMVLKTNDALEKGIMTGCLRISKESIFTGLNNFSSYSILDTISNEYFGFTQNEVNELLKNYNLSVYINEVKKWYDGYLFGNIDIYNPWSTLAYVKNKIHNSDFYPTSFWANTSENEIVVNYIQSGDRKLKQEFEALMNHQTLVKYIKPELTYREMDNINNIYSFLLFTGYLKVAKDLKENKYELLIPNKEIFEIYKQTFMSYFEDFKSSKKNILYHEFIQGNTKQINQLLNEILLNSISFYDNQESFYHGFLVGLLNDHEILSNRESGNGRFDICILPDNLFGTVLLIECKHSLNEDHLIEDAKLGIQQILDKKYLEEKTFTKYNDIIGYSISFYKKQCYVEKVTAEN